MITEDDDDPHNDDHDASNSCWVILISIVSNISQNHVFLNLSFSFCRCFACGLDS